MVEWRVDHFTRVEVADLNRTEVAMQPVGTPVVGPGGHETPC